MPLTFSNALWLWSWKAHLETLGSTLLLVVPYSLISFMALFEMIQTLISRKIDGSVILLFITCFLICTSFPLWGLVLWLWSFLIQVIGICLTLASNIPCWTGKPWMCLSPYSIRRGPSSSNPSKGFSCHSFLLLGAESFLTNSLFSSWKIKYFQEG